MIRLPHHRAQEHTSQEAAQTGAALHAAPRPGRLFVVSGYDNAVRLSVHDVVLGDSHVLLGPTKGREFCLPFLESFGQASGTPFGVQGVFLGPSGSVATPAAGRTTGPTGRARFVYPNLDPNAEATPMTGLSAVLDVPSHPRGAPPTAHHRPDTTGRTPRHATQTSTKPPPLRTYCARFWS